MDQEFGIGVPLSLRREHVRRQGGVHVTLTHPHVQLAPGHPPQIAAEEEVRDEQHRDVGREGANHGDRVPRRTAVVRLGLDGRAAVDVGHHETVAMPGAPRPHVLGLDRGGERAAGLGIGDEDALIRVGDGGRFGHELHSADHQQGRIELGGPTRHLERVGHDVGQILDRRNLVVVRQDGRVALGLERLDFRDQVRGHRRTYDARRIGIRTRVFSHSRTSSVAFPAAGENFSVSVSTGAPSDSVVTVPAPTSFARTSLSMGTPQR